MFQIFRMPARIILLSHLAVLHSERRLVNHYGYKLIAIVFTKGLQACPSWVFF